MMRLHDILPVRRPARQGGFGALTGALLVLLAAATLSPGLAAQTSQQSSPTVDDSIALLHTKIERRLLDRARLQRMLDALNLVDSTYKPLYPAWLVLDDDLRERVDRIFRERDTSVTHGGNVVVVANPRTNEILDLSVGSAHMGRLETRRVLSDSLHAALLHGEYQKRPVDLTVEKPRTEELEEQPRYATLTASAFAVRLITTSGLGIEALIGQEDIGYHFWSAGDMSLRLIVKGLKVGALLPFPYGYRTTLTLQPLAIKPTLLVGSSGFSGEYEQPFGDNKAGVRLAVGELYLGNLNQKVPDSVTAYSLHTVAQAYFAHDMRWGLDAFTFTGGIGFHQVTHDQADNAANQVVTLEKLNFASPLLRVDYTRMGEKMYGASVQYYHSALLVAGWVEVVRNFLYLDLKYFAPIARDPDPWEQRYFFMISPRIRISY